MTSEQTLSKLQELTNTLATELIQLTPESMSEIQFEIVATDDGGADIGLLENHPDATKVALSETIYTVAAHYLPLVKQYVPGWTRSVMVLNETEEGWKVKVDFEHGEP